MMITSIRINQASTLGVRTYGGNKSVPEGEDGAQRDGAEKTSPDKALPRSNASNNANQLSAAEEAEVEKLKSTATKVRAHEMAHLTAGAQYITRGASYKYKRGPDGANYEVAGEVGIDTSAVPGDPRATIRKMEVVKQAALAPAEPSNQDLKVAAKATQAEANARMELVLMQSGEYRRLGEKGTPAESLNKMNGNAYNPVNQTQNEKRAVHIDLVV